MSTSCSGELKKGKTHKNNTRWALFGVAPVCCGQYGEKKQRSLVHWNKTSYIECGTKESSFA